MAKETSHALLQKLMRKYRVFLFGLYSESRGWKNRKTLQNTSNVCIFLILRLLFCISVGHIPLRYCNYKLLIKSKRRQLLGSLKYNFRSILDSSTEEKRKYVLKFASLYHALLEPLFEAAK